MEKYLVFIFWNLVIVVLVKCLEKHLNFLHYISAELFRVVCVQCIFYKLLYSNWFFVRTVKLKYSFSPFPDFFRLFTYMYKKWRLSNNILKEIVIILIF